MKIAIISSMVPHIDGGYRKFVDLLAPRLQDAGHVVEKIWLPFSGDPASMLSEMVAYRMADYDSAFDMVICTRPPAYVVRHRRKVVWFIHHERAFYDLWDTAYNGLAVTAYSDSLRKAIVKVDSKCLREARQVLSNSKVVSERLKKFNQIESAVLYPPIADDFTINHAIYGDELFFNCRIEHHKRQHLAIEAMARTKTPVRLRIAGKSQSTEYIAALQSAIASFGLEDRVTIDNRWISEGEKRHLLGHSLACVYIPFDEDSYGYPTLEAARARRATISATDAGGVSEFVHDGVNGFLCAPEPEAMAHAFDLLWKDRQLARSLGKTAQDTMVNMQISWDHVVKRLTA